MKNVYIVTGGAGFIGSALVWGLNQRGIDNILVVDQLGDNDKWRNLAPLRFRDYMEKDQFRDYLKDNRPRDRVEAIFHMGACSATTENDASFLIDNNFNYSKEVATFAATRGIPFFHASSAATYGDGEQGYKDDQDNLHQLRPLNAYGYSKHIFDLWCRYHRLLDKVTTFKFTNIYGPNEGHKKDMRSVVCKAYEQIQTLGKVQLFKSHRPEYHDGEQKRDFLYVKEAVKMVLHFLEHPAPGIYNIGSGRAESWNKLVNAIFRSLGRETNIEYIDMPEQLRGRYQYYTRAEIRKLRNAGFHDEPQKIQESINDYVITYLRNDLRLGDESPTLPKPRATPHLPPNRGKKKPRKGGHETQTHAF